MQKETARILALLGSGAAATIAILVGTNGSGVIPQEEGRRQRAYLDPVGIPTICEGWTAGVKLGDWKSNAECDELTLRGIREAAEIFARHVPAEVRDKLPPATTASFLSFIYNIGPGAPGKKDGFVWLKNGNNSTMLRRLRAGDVRSACLQMPAWATGVGGVKLRGLTLRRDREMKLCLQDLPATPAAPAKVAP